GTGTIPMLFRRAATPDATPALITTNPHSQILATATELGLVGAVALLAMWIAHLALFRAGTPVAWIGLLVVTYNIVSSLFNSHLFDFGQGWLYVFGVGVTGERCCEPWMRQTKPRRSYERLAAQHPPRHLGADLGRRADGQDHNPRNKVRAH